MKFEGNQINIPIKGIMRAGTDNLAADGAMNEVIGMEYKDGSWLPYKTEDKEYYRFKWLNTSLNPPTWPELPTRVSKVYVHKTSDGVSRRIFLSARVLYYEDHEEVDEGKNYIYIKRLTTNVNSFEIVGNLLCVSTDTGLEYYLWDKKEVKYKTYTPKEIYEALPEVYFKVTSFESGHAMESDGTTGHILYAKSEFLDRSLLSSLQQIGADWLNMGASNLISSTAAKAQYMVSEKGRFYGGFLVCAAYRLKSGEYIAATPILLMNPPSFSVGTGDTQYKLYIPRDALTDISTTSSITFKGGVNSADLWSSACTPRVAHTQIGNDIVCFPTRPASFDGQHLYHADSFYELPSLFAYFHDVHDLSDAFLGSVVAGCASNLLEFKIGRDISQELRYLIDSVCIFVSEQVPMNKELSGENVQFLGARMLSSAATYSASWRFALRSTQDYIEQVSKIKNLYMVHEIPFGKIKQSSSWEVPNLEGKLGDALYTLPSLPVSALVKDSIISGNLDTYNRRLHIYNYTQKTYKGHETVEFRCSGGVGQYGNGNEADLTYDVYSKVTIDGEFGTVEVWRKNTVTPYRLNPMITYPNPDATSLDLFFKRPSEAKWKKIHMALTTSSNGQYAYYINPYADPIYVDSNYPGPPIEELDNAPTITDINNINTYINRMRVSDQAFASYFPDRNTYVIGNMEIIGLAKLTIPLSQDTYGRYPLIAFCKDGVYSLGVDTSGDGAYTNQPPPLSPEVCVNKNTICEIGGAVIFASDKGLMMVTQNGVEEFCPHLNGEIRFSPDDSATTHKSGAAIYNKMVNEQHLVTLSDALSSQDFIDYLWKQDTVVSYISKKNKLIVYNKTMQYVYLIDIPTRNATKIYTNVAFDDDNFPEEIYWEVINESEANELAYSYITKQFTYRSQDGYIDCLIQSRPIKVQQDDKCSYRVVLTGYFDGQPNDWAGLVVLGSLDANNWRVIGVKEKKLNGGFHNLGCLTERGSWKYLMFIFAGRLSNESHIDSIDITVNGKYNNKKR